METINHERIEHLCVIVVTGKIFWVAYYFTIFQWDKQVVELFAIAESVYAYKGTPLAFTPCFFDGDDSFRIVLTIANILCRSSILPEDTEL